MKNKTITLFAFLFSLSNCYAQTTLDSEQPLFKKSLPNKFFQCNKSEECVIAQGWCSTFSINKKYFSDYNKLPYDAKGKNLQSCPPGWLPPKPIPTCIQNQCVLK